jgi:hypothetical protein
MITSEVEPSEGCVTKVLSFTRTFLGAKQCVETAKANKIAD